MDNAAGPAGAPSRWGPRAWIALVVAAAVHLVLVFVATALVGLDTQGVCHEPAAPADLARARWQLAAVVALSLGPWLPGSALALRRRRHRAALLLAAAVVTLFPAWTLVSALFASPAEWTTQWCVF